MPGRRLPVNAKAGAAAAASLPFLNLALKQQRLWRHEASSLVARSFRAVYEIDPVMFTGETDIFWTILRMSKTYPEVVISFALVANSKMEKSKGVRHLGHAAETEMDG